MNESQDIDVLREMVRIAEKNRSEDLERVEKVNQYNIALIGFAGGFLSLLVTVHFPYFTVVIAGILLIFSILLSLLSLMPRVIMGTAVRIDEDVVTIKKNGKISLQQFLLETADITERASIIIAKRGHEKKMITIYSVIFLALALFVTYTLYVIYA